jgi:hypothetical protein
VTTRYAPERQAERLGAVLAERFPGALPASAAACAADG